MTGATTSTRSEPSSGKHTISLLRGAMWRYAPPPQAYCWLAGVPGWALAWER